MWANGWREPATRVADGDGGGYRRKTAARGRSTSDGMDSVARCFALMKASLSVITSAACHPSFEDTWKYPWINISIRCRRSCAHSGLCVYQKGAISIRKGRDNPGDSHRPRLTSKGWLWKPGRFGANQPPGGRRGWWWVTMFASDDLHARTSASASPRNHGAYQVKVRVVR